MTISSAPELEGSLPLDSSAQAAVSARIRDFFNHEEAMDAHTYLVERENLMTELREFRIWNCSVMKSGSGSRGWLLLGFFDDFVAIYDESDRLILYKQLDFIQAANRLAIAIQPVLW